MDRQQRGRGRCARQNLNLGLTMGFQTAVQTQPGVGEEGDFGDANIRASVIGAPGAFVAAPTPRAPIVGRFNWADQATTLVYGNYRGELTAKLGFLHREQQALITTFLADSTQRINQGIPVTLHDQGCFWAKFAAGASVGQKVFANYVDGSCYAAATGTSTVDATGTASIDVTTGVLHVTVLATGTFKVGDVLTGANIPAGTAITAQLSGTIGGVGTYQTSTILAAASGAVTASGSVETAFIVENPAAAGELAKITTWG